MAYTVFFREENEIFPSSTYISQQLKAHREILQRMADELAVKGSLAHTAATKTANGDWWLMLKDDNGDVYTYLFFISRFEEEEIKIEQSPKKKELVIIDPAGSKDSVGGYHPGYWTVANYAALLEAKQAKLFLQTISQVEQNVPSEYYTLNGDGSIAIHIRKEEKAYTILVECRAEWK